MLGRIWPQENGPEKVPGHGVPQGPRLAETPIAYPLPWGSDPFAVPGVTGAGVCGYLQNFGQRTKGAVVVLEGPGLTPTARWLSTEWGPERPAAGSGCSRDVLVLCLLPGRGFPRELVVEEVPLWEVGHPWPCPVATQPVESS